MSVLVEIDSLPMEQRKQMLIDLHIKTIVKKGKKQYTATNTFDVYEVRDEDYVCLPFAYYFQQLGLGFPNAERKFEAISARFNIQLFERQKEIREEALEILNTNHSIILSLYCGYGKTIFSIYLACKIRLKTVIFCHRIILIDQWEKSLKRVCGDDVRVQIVKTNSKIDNEADFYIINVSTVEKLGEGIFENCGLVIADECHTLCTEKYSKAFRYVFPKYLICLTATPVRSDGKDRVIELYGGPNIIYKTLNALFNVYLIKSGFAPKLEKSEKDELNWNDVLEKQSVNGPRNKLLVDIIRYFGTRNILVTCKRKSHALILSEMLKEYGEDVDCYMGSDRIVNYECRILIVTYSKGGTGFDHPKLDMLLVAGDAEENWVQYLGRVFRREWHAPIIVDVQDKFFPLKKHADARCEIYKQSGGQVKNLERYFPCFEEWIKNDFKE